MLVIDTSALVHLLVGEDRDPALVERLAADGALSAPHLIDIELLNALRGLVRGRKISADLAAVARMDYADLALERHRHDHLADRIWDVRNSLTPYDAAFAVLAEMLDVPLITCDRKLARTAHTFAEVELYG